MCFFKKKKKKEEPQIDSKYQLGEMIRFRYKGEISTGYIYRVYLKGEEIYYDIQIGGECPAIVESVKQEIILPRKSA